MSGAIGAIADDPDACCFVSQQIDAAAEVLSRAIDVAREGGHADLALVMTQPYVLMIAAGNGLLLRPLPRSAAAMICVALRFLLETQWQAFEELAASPLAQASHELHRASGFLATTLGDIGFGHLVEKFKI